MSHDDNLDFERKVFDQPVMSDDDYKYFPMELEDGRWILACERNDGSYEAPHVDAEPGGVQAVFGRRLGDLTHATPVYTSRDAAAQARLEIVDGADGAR